MDLFFPSTDASQAGDSGPRPSGALDERRRLTRLPVQALVLYVEGRSFLGRGDLSTGGGRWTGRGLPAQWLRGGVVLGVRLPGMGAEVCVAGQVYCVRAAGDWTEVRVRFGTLPPALQQAIQRYSDDWFLVADASGLLGL